MSDELRRLREAHDLLTLASDQVVLTVDGIKRPDYGPLVDQTLAAACKDAELALANLDSIVVDRARARFKAELRKAFLESWAGRYGEAVCRWLQRFVG